jgi:colicin import membrane protein
VRKAPAPPPRALEKRPQPGRVRAVILAVLVHGLFFSLIVFGVTWQSRPTGPLQAELWDKLPPAKSKAPPPPPKVEPKPEPPKPEPPKPEVKPEPPKPDPAAIAEKLEREKKEKEKRERIEREKEEKAKKQKEEQARKKQEQEELARKKKEDEERVRQEKERQIAEQRAREQAVQARQREIDAWVQKIQTKIRSRANIPDTVTGSPEPRFRIHVLPGGEVLDITLTKPSGNAAYDAAIERAIRSASPLPVPPPSSELFPQFRELNLDFKHER